MQKLSLSGRVLLIDDDANFHQLVSAVVESIGFECVCVRSGEEGLQRIEEGPPAVLILDGLLPGMRGEDVAKKLRKKFTPAQLPIVFVTAFYRDLRSSRFLTGDCGVNVLLHKPLVADQLRAALGQLLQREEAFDLEVDFDPLGPDAEARAEILADYLASTKEKVVGMRAAFHSLGGADGTAALRSLRMDAHRLRGSGASFGFPEISRLAGAIEDLVNRSGDELMMTGPTRARLDGLVEALGAKVRATVGAAPVAVARSRGWRPKVLLVEAEGPLVVEAAGAPEDERLRILGSVDEAIEAAIDERPDVVVLGLDAGGAEACSRMRAAGIGPVVIMSRGDTLAERLMASEAGVVGYVARPSDLDGLFRIASTFANPRIGTRVVAAGGDRAILAQIAEALAPAGVAVDPAPEPGELLPMIHERAPSLVILDVDSWKVGPQLLRVHRADLRLRQVPILAITEAADRTALLEAGAAAILPKPFEPAELAATVVSLLAQRQSGDVSRGRDPRTGLYDRSYLRRASERAVALARREGRTLALVAFDANAEALRLAHGSLAVDELLAAIATHLHAAFRDSDVVARIGPHRFAILLHSARRFDVERLISRELAALAKLDLGFPDFVPAPRAELVVFPEAAVEPDSILETVDSKLNAALEK